MTRRIISLVLLATALTPLAGTVGASAVPAQESTLLPAARISAPAQDPLEFWTPQRLASARPAEAPAGTPSTVPAHADGPAVEHPGALPVASAESAAGGVTPLAGGWEWGGPQHTAPASTTGRIFWTEGIFVHYCSGSAVNSGNKDLVFTAGHCVHKGKGGGYYLNNNWVFAPNYRDGVDPLYGLWSPRLMQTTVGWSNNDDRFDFGAVLVHPRLGQHLVNVVGGQGITWNQPAQQFSVAFGYPTTGNHNGNRLIYCSGNSVPDASFAAPQPIGLSCDQDSGASGGPWLRNLGGNGLGQLNSVFGFVNALKPGWTFGPYFGVVAGTLFNATANA